MIIKTIKIKDLDYEHDTLEDVIDGCGAISDGDCEPVIVDVRKNGKYSLSDGYHRLAGMMLNDEENITIGILEDSDWERHREEFAEEFENEDISDEYEHLVDWLSDNL